MTSAGGAQPSSPFPLSFYLVLLVTLTCASFCSCITYTLTALAGMFCVIIEIRVDLLTSSNLVVSLLKFHRKLSLTGLNGTSRRIGPHECEVLDIRIHTSSRLIRTSIL